MPRKTKPLKGWQAAARAKPYCYTDDTRERIEKAIGPDLVVEVERAAGVYFADELLFDNAPHPSQVSAAAREVTGKAAALRVALEQTEKPLMSLYTALSGRELDGMTSQLLTLAAWELAERAGLDSEQRVAQATSVLKGLTGQKGSLWRLKLLCRFLRQTLSDLERAAQHLANNPSHNTPSSDGLSPSRGGRPRKTAARIFIESLRNIWIAAGKPPPTPRSNAFQDFVNDCFHCNPTAGVPDDLIRAVLGKPPAK